MHVVKPVILLNQKVWQNPLSCVCFFMISCLTPSCAYTKEYILHADEGPIYGHINLNEEVVFDHEKSIKWRLI